MSPQMRVTKGLIQRLRYPYVDNNRHSEFPLPIPIPMPTPQCLMDLMDGSVGRYLPEQTHSQGLEKLEV